MKTVGLGKGYIVFSDLFQKKIVGFRLILVFLYSIQMRKSFQIGKQKLVLHRPEIFRIAKAVKSRSNSSQQKQKEEFCIKRETIAEFSQGGDGIKEEDELKVRRRAVSNATKLERSSSALKLRLQRDQNHFGRKQNDKPWKMEKSGIKVDGKQIEDVVSGAIDQLKTSGSYIKQKSEFLLSQSHLYNFLIELVKDLVQKDATIDDKPIRKHKEDLNQKKCQDLAEEKVLKLTTEVNYSVVPVHRKQLSFAHQNIEFLGKFQPIRVQSQILWSLCEKYQRKEHSELELQFLLQKINFIKQQKLQQQKQLEAISQKISSVDEKLQLKKAEIGSLQHDIRFKQQKRDQYSSQLLKIKTFEKTKEGTMLRNQVLEYKQTEQEMFNMADMFALTTPYDVGSWLGREIAFPDQNFNYELGAFCSYILSRDDKDVIDYGQVQNYKNNIERYFSTATKKLSGIVDEKCEKMRIFIDLMVRLSQCTEAKREYLEKINREMAAVKIRMGEVERQLQKAVQEYFSRFHEKSSIMKNYRLLKQLISKIGGLYMQAEIFY